MIAGCQYVIYLNNPKKYVWLLAELNRIKPYLFEPDIYLRTWLQPATELLFIITLINELLCYYLIHGIDNHNLFY
jgi:hypothetical protein